MLIPYHAMIFRVSSVPIFLSILYRLIPSQVFFPSQFSTVLMIFRLGQKNEIFFEPPRLIIIFIPSTKKG